MMSENKNIKNNMDEINTGENNMIVDKTSETYSIVETIENGKVMATASPDLWIKDHVLLWPPGTANRRNPIPPQPNWIPHMCRILKGSIATLDEALELEQMYSAHNDSKSFREAQAQKQLRREHPVIENPQIDLIDANSMINEIDRQANKPEADKNCHENNNDDLFSETSKKTNVVKADVKQERPTTKNPLKSKNTNIKQGNVVKDNEKQTRRRYINYLKSASRTNKFSSKKPNPPLQQKKIVPPKKTVISATITKDQYFEQNGISETENQDPLSPISSNVPSAVREVSKSYTGFAALQTSLSSVNHVNNYTTDENEGQKKYTDTTKSNQGVIKKRTVNVLEDYLIEPPSSSTPIFTGTNFQERVLKELNELKNEQKQKDEKRVLFEARMEAKMDIFMRGMPRNQGQSQSKYQEPQEPDFIDEDDDFEDLDEIFPIKKDAKVLELNFSLKRDLTFNHRLQKRLNELTGTNPKASIREKFKYLIADCALEKFTWRGAIEPIPKKPFKQLVALNGLIYKSVRWQFPKYKKTEYKDYLVNNWLKHSRSRQRIVTYSYPNRNERNGDHSDFDEQVDDEHEDQDMDY